MWRGVNPTGFAALGSAPPSSKACTTTGVSLYCAAVWRGVHPTGFAALGSAPASSKTCTTAGVSLFPTAMWRGVHSGVNPYPNLVRAFTLAPPSSRAFTTAGFSVNTAVWRGVNPRTLLCVLGSAPFDRQRATSVADASLKKLSVFQSSQSGRACAGLNPPRTRGAISRGATLLLNHRVSIQSGSNVKPILPWRPAPWAWARASRSTDFR